MCYACGWHMSHIIFYADSEVSGKWRCWRENLNCWMVFEFDTLFKFTSVNRFICVKVYVPIEKRKPQQISINKALRLSWMTFFTFVTIFRMALCHMDNDIKQPQQVQYWCRHNWGKASSMSEFIMVCSTKTFSKREVCRHWASRRNNTNWIVRLNVASEFKEWREYGTRLCSIFPIYVSLFQVQTQFSSNIDLLLLTILWLFYAVYF